MAITNGTISLKLNNSSEWVLLFDKLPDSVILLLHAVNRYTVLKLSPCLCQISLAHTIHNWQVNYHDFRNLTVQYNVTALYQC